MLFAMADEPPGFNGALSACSARLGWVRSCVASCRLRASSSLELGAHDRKLTGLSVPAGPLNRYYPVVSFLTGRGAAYAPPLFSLSLIPSLAMSARYFWMSCLAM